MKPKAKIFISFAIVVVAMAFLVFFGFNNKTMVYYSTIKELKSKGEGAYNQGFRVSGTVVPGSVQKIDQAVQVRFAVTEEGEKLQVIYSGILPDTFKEGMDVLVEGKYQKDGTFAATHVFTKCASKYEATDGKSKAKGSDT